MMYCKDDPQICSNSNRYSDSARGSFLDVIMVLGTYGYKTIDEVPYTTNPIECPGMGRGQTDFIGDIFYEKKNDREV